MVILRLNWVYRFEDIYIFVYEFYISRVLSVPVFIHTCQAFWLKQSFVVLGSRLRCFDLTLTFISSPRPCNPLSARIIARSL